MIELDAEGLVLGVQKEVLFVEKMNRVEPGDISVLYTDGIPEAQNFSGEFFGRVRLWEALAERHEDSPDAIATAIFNALTLFAGPKPLEDDTTLIIVKIV